MVTIYQPVRKKSYISRHKWDAKTCNLHISAKNKDIDTKLSGYDPWGLPSTSIMSWMSLSSKSLIRNPLRPPSTPILDPPFLTYF